LAPFPYIKSAAGSLLLLLQAIEVCSPPLDNGLFFELSYAES
jgi:hypothetical protein